ncbi:MAG: hypothetical protein DRI01_06960 [Chloroflexi bacterium]|nr:MAG: hypothetical protein DRI01_06960 [Chloroflexota bacterium]
MAEANHLEESLPEIIGRKNYVRAVVLAQKLGYPESEIRHMQELALKQMACDYRNGFAVRNLAREWGFSKADLENVLMTALGEYENVSDKKRLRQCYDVKTGKYLTLLQWVKQFLSA